MLYKQISQNVILALLLVGCSAQPKTESAHHNFNASKPAENSHTENTLSDIDISGITLPETHIVSPSSHDHFLYIFDNSGAFESVRNGYFDEGLEIRVQRGVDVINKGEATFSLLLSASTLFLLPAYSNVEDTHSFSVYYSGEYLKRFDYKNSRANFVTLFNLSSANITDQEIMRQVDEYVVKGFIKDLHDSKILNIFIQ